MDRGERSALNPKGERPTRPRGRGWACLALILSSMLASPSAAGASAFLNLINTGVVLTPSPTDYANDYVEATGPAGIAIKVKNTSPTGMVLMVRSVSSAPAIAFGDLLVRTLTPPGTGGSSLAAYTPLGPSNLNLWSTGVAQGPFQVVEMDVRIRNLFNYGDAGSAGTTSYTNTLIFTVIEP